METPSPKTAIVIGAGPAGLTAAYELLQQAGIRPIVLESGDAVGGLSRTVQYKDYRMDLGGHRFFSKSDRVMRWWMDRMPLETKASGILRYQNQIRAIPESSAPPADEDRVMLVRERKSRIYFLRRLFAYPIRISRDTLQKLGLLRTLHFVGSYLLAAVFPRREEKTLEDFLINRFGRQLYKAFFQSYTQKVWGVDCDAISAEWGAQRIKGLSLMEVLRHRLRKPSEGIAQKQTETSLIERFLYPKFGPGQLWQHVADCIREQGGEIHLGMQVDRVTIAEGRVMAVEARGANGQRVQFSGEYFFSTMPVQELVRALEPPAPPAVVEVSEGLQYRDFITVGLLASRLLVHEPEGGRLKDNWIYIHEPEVMVGRLQIFNNWSPWLVRDPEKIWMGLEYFCNQTDSLWQKTDAEMAQFAIEEASRIGLLATADVEDWHVVRVPKTYPAYFGSYDHFSVIREYVDGLENLFLIGRNGMHKYNNQDHSMLTAMTAVENIVRGVRTKDNLWAINTELEYHEEKTQKSAD